MATAHSIVRLSAQIFNKPQYMKEESFLELTDYVINRNSGNLEWQLDISSELRRQKAEDKEESEGKILSLNPMKASSYDKPDLSLYPAELQSAVLQEYYDHIQYDPNTKLGMLNVEGTLVYRSSAFDSLCGMTSYQNLENKLKAQLSEGAKTVLMYVDSGGGEAYGNVETAATIRALLDKSGAKMIAFIDGSSASAAYALTAVADQVIATADSEVGSIGVVISLLDRSQTVQESKNKKVTMFRGDNKVGVDDEGKFKAGFIDRVNNMLDSSYKKFTEHVATSRGLSVQDVVNTQASVYLAEDSLKVGLIDKIMTRYEFFSSYLPNVLSQSNATSFSSFAETGVFKMKSEDKENMNIEELKGQLNAETGLISVKQEDLDSYVLAQVEAAKLEAVEATKLDYEQKLTDKDALLATAQEDLEKVTQEFSQHKADVITKQREEQLGKVLSEDEMPAALNLVASFTDEQFNTYYASLESLYKKSKANIEEIGTQVKQDSSPEKFDDIMATIITQRNTSR